MFSIFNKRKKIIVDCFTSNHNAFQYAPIIKTIKTIPNWWKQLPDISNKVINHDEMTNMSRCYGMTELYKKGFVIENWADLVVDVTEKEGYTYSYSDGESPSQHKNEQYNGGFKNHFHMKLISPWRFRENSGTHFLFSPATWSLDNYTFTILPGVIEFKINHTTNINLMMPNSYSYNFYLPIGQPLIHIIPLTDDKVEFKNHLVDDNELKKLASNNISFRGFREIIKLDKRNEERKGKCPFNFS